MRVAGAVRRVTVGAGCLSMTIATGGRPRRSIHVVTWLFLLAVLRVPAAGAALAAPVDGAMAMINAHPSVPRPSNDGHLERPAGLGGGAAQLSLVSGSCTLASGGLCARSHNYPGRYNNNERCTITVSGAATLTATAFHTESGYDYVKVLPSSTRHSGSSFPPNGIAVTSSSSITWYTDDSNVQSGWELCLVPPPPPPVHWVEGASSQSCDSACTSAGSMCVSGTPAVHSLGIQMIAAALGVSCSTGSQVDVNGLPFLNQSSCYAQPPSATTVNCATAYSSARRFCPCAPLEPPPPPPVRFPHICIAHFS
jgi:hypothetical protein